MNTLPYERKIDMGVVSSNLLLANNKIGELNGMIKLLPNPRVILNAITIGEAKDSSAIENIVTTYDDIFKSMVAKNQGDTSAKEVANYRAAMNYGLETIQNRKGLLTTNGIIEIHRIVEPDKGNIRRLPGTFIKNTSTGEVLFTPPQNESEIRDLLSNLERYINDDDMEKIDPLLKLAPIHYQFECIHPFYDGNGRTGRIVNMLYLVMKGKLDQPILYMSKYINESRDEYYAILHGIATGERSITDLSNYLLIGIIKMSEFTMAFIVSFLEAVKRTESLLKSKLPKKWSHELVEHLFFDFYTKNEYIRSALGVSRNTATAYLKSLVREGFLTEEKVGKEMIYKNVALFDLVNGK